MTIKANGEHSYLWREAFLTEPVGRWVSAAGHFLWLVAQALGQRIPEPHPAPRQMNWPAQAHYNRLQWLSLVEPLMLQAANRACNEAMRVAAEGAPLAGKEPQPGAIAIIFGGCVAPSSPSASPVSNHGATLARGVM